MEVWILFHLCTSPMPHLELNSTHCVTLSRVLAFTHTLIINVTICQCVLALSVACLCLIVWGASLSDLAIFSALLKMNFDLLWSTLVSLNTASVALSCGESLKQYEPRPLWSTLLIAPMNYVIYPSLEALKCVLSDLTNKHRQTCWLI